MAIGRRKGRGGGGRSGAPRRTAVSEARPVRAARVRWMAGGAAVVGLLVAIGALVVAAARGGDETRLEGRRADAVRPIAAAVETALEPLGLRAGPDLLAAPAAFASALDGATDDPGVLRAAAAAEGLLGLLGPAREGIAAIDVPGAVRDRELDEGFVVDLIQARARMLEAIDLYAAAARLAAEGPVLDRPTLDAILATARDLAAQAEATFLEGHDLLVEAQVAAGTYGGPLVPGAAAGGALG